MFQEPVLTRIRECLSAELRPRDRVFSESLGAGFNRITPTQGARSGAAVMMCRDMGMTELKERARIIWSGIQRSYSSMVGTYSPDLLENLRQQFAEHLTSESLKVTGYAAEPWRASTKSGREYQLYRLVYEAIHLTTFNELRGQYDVEAQFYVDSVKTPPGNRTEAQAGVMNVFNAPIGVVQQGHHSSAQVIIEPADTVALRDALQVLTRTIQGSAAMSAETKASNQDIISDLESAIKVERPNKLLRVREVLVRAFHSVDRHSLSLLNLL